METLKHLSSQSPTKLFYTKTKNQFQVGAFALCTIEHTIHRMLGIKYHPRPDHSLNAIFICILFLMGFNKFHLYSYLWYWDSNNDNVTLCFFSPFNLTYVHCIVAFSLDPIFRQIKIEIVRYRIKLYRNYFHLSPFITHFLITFYKENKLLADTSALPLYVTQRATTC